MNRLAWLLLAGWLGVGPAGAPAEPTPVPATIQVSGHGWWGNRELRRVLRLLETADTLPAALDANHIEDAATLLLSKLEHDGFLAARVTVTLTLADGSRRETTWKQGFTTYLPRPAAVTRARFRVRPGVRYYLKAVAIDGLTALPQADALRFFVARDSLLITRGARVYTPGRLARSQANLAETLRRKGYETAQVTIAELDRDDNRGAVRVVLAVAEGPQSWVRSVVVETFAADAATPSTTRRLTPGVPYSPLWAQDFRQALRVAELHRGHPDATVTLAIVERATVAETAQLDLRAEVRQGPAIQVGAVRFEGHQKTRPGVLARRVKLAAGAPLDPLAVERGRHRLARLGIFDAVDARYEPVDDATRNVVYELDEGRTLDVSLVFGYGSYELLRGGFELEQFNLFGRAHRARLRAIQSFKATSGDYLYTMPELIGEDIDMFFSVSGLRREEVAFTREEFAATVGGQRHAAVIDSDVGLRYSYQFLNARDAAPALTDTAQRARVGALILDVKHDSRDNPLLPRQGFKLFSTLEAAASYLGGEVEYQRLELSAAYHHKLGHGRGLHFGVSHGGLLTLGGARADVPFNKRFFPGGENSIRGYKEGEAAPRDADGNLIGAETYLLANVEFEQYLTPAWSVVAFVDAVGFAANVNAYPFDETLCSVGGGIRWRTIIGPARLEYGRNLNPRRRDPAGTLHVSIGFPF